MKKSFLVFNIITITLLFLILGTTIFSGCVKSPQPIKSLSAEQELAKFNKLFKEGTPFYTLTEATDIAYELMPEIERLAGKKFLSRPQIRLINTAEAVVILKQQHAFPLSNSKNQFQNFFDKREEALIQLMSKTVGGIYEPKHKRLNLIPTHIEPMLRFMRLGYRHGMLIVKMTIAHELTHALQDQHIDLDKKMKRAPGADERQAFAATIEGHAEFIEKEMGKRLGAKYYQSDKDTNLEFKNPLIKKIFSSDSPHVLKYKKGLQFIEYHFKKGGNPLLWKILENPPVDTAMINYPETYRPKPYDTFDHKVILEDIYDFTVINKNIKFEYYNFSLSKFSIRYLFSDLKWPDKNHIISKIDHYQNLIVTHKNITFAKIAFVILTNEEYALKYTELEQIYKTKKTGISFLEMPNNYFCKRKSIKIAKEILTHVKLKTIYGQEELVRMKYAILAKNNMVVIYNDLSFWLDSCEILKIAEKIFTRYENAKNSEKNNKFN